MTKSVIDTPEVQVVDPILETEDKPTLNIEEDALEVPVEDTPLSSTTEEPKGERKVTPGSGLAGGSSESKKKTATKTVAKKTVKKKDAERPNHND